MTGRMNPKPLVQACEEFLPTDDGHWLLDCARPPGHTGDHETAAGQKWQIREPGDQPA